MRALVIGGTGSTGVDVVRGLVERGHDVRLLHRGVHEPAGLPDVPHVHADPHFAESLTEAVGDESFDVVLAMYGRVKVIADVFAGRTGHLVGVGGVPAYRGCLEPERLPAAVEEVQVNRGKMPLEDGFHLLAVTAAFQKVQLSLYAAQPESSRRKQGSAALAEDHSKDKQQVLVCRGRHFEWKARDGPIEQRALDRKAIDGSPVIAKH